MKKILTISFLVSSLIIYPFKATKANPAVLAPLGLCSTGVGCVLVGVVLIGGVSYYVWKQSSRRILSSSIGSIYRVLEDPEEELTSSGRPGDAGYWEDYTSANNLQIAIKNCQTSAKKNRAELIEVIYDYTRRQFVCRFKGGNSR